MPTELDVELARARALGDVKRRDLRALHGSAKRLALLDIEVDYEIIASAAASDRERRRALLPELRKHSATGEIALISWAAEQAIARRGLSISKGSLSFRRICAALLRAWIEVLERSAERDQGDWSGAPRDPKVVSALAVAEGVDLPRNRAEAADSEDAERVDELFGRYSRENPGNVKADTIDQSCKIMALFFQSLPKPRFPACKITKKEVREWKHLLQQYPVKASEISAFKDKSISEIVELNRSLGKPTLSARSVNKYLSALGAYCSWLVNHGYLDANPVDGLFVRLDRDQGPVRPCSTDQLNAIFTSPLYTGCLSESEWQRPGSVIFADHRYWLPLLALFTGARLGELAQLRTEDIREMHGHLVIHITREGGKSTKTKGSQRIVPVHTVLIGLGFSSYVEEQRRKGSAPLFPHVGPNARGQIAGDYSRAYGRFLLKLGVKHGRELNFHSFRHTFADALRRAGYRDEQFGFLLGHTQASTTGRYGILSEGSLSDRVRLVSAVCYPGLHFPLPFGSSADRED